MTKDNKIASYDALYAEEAAIARAQALICWVMDQNEVSQRALADRLSISEAAISKMLGSTPENLSVRRLARVLYALGDKLNLSSELRDTVVPHQPACGVTTGHLVSVWEDCKESTPLTHDDYGGRMIFEDILHPSDELLHKNKDNIFAKETLAPHWNKILSGAVINQTTQQRNRMLEDA